MEFLRVLFSHVCGQQHCWNLGGLTLPFCQRCTGLYVGAFLALLLVAVFRPRPCASLYWLHGTFMLVMFPFGFHLVQHGALARTMTGALFAFGLVYYLLLNPLSVRIGWKENHAGRIVSYLSLIVLCISLLLASVRWGGAANAILLTGLGALGLFVLITLTLANLLALPGILRLLHSSASSSS